MKKMISILMLTIVLALILEIPTEAGKVTTVNDILDANGQLNVTDWYDPNDELEIVQGNLIIPNDSTFETRIVSKSMAKVCTSKELVELSCDLQFTKLTEGEKFILGLGLSSIEAYSGDAGNVEVEFVKQEGISACITAYDENGDAQTVATLKKCSKSENAKLSVQVMITTDRDITLAVNGSQILSGELPVTGEGRVGLLQTGGCGAKVSRLSAQFTSYERPENTDFVENFEDGLYNTNLFTMKFEQGSLLPSELCVEEYEGSNVLMFRNTGLCYFGTKYAYSNFELTFDVPYFVRQVVKDEEGNTVRTPAAFGVSMGDETIDLREWGFDDSTDLIHFATRNVNSFNYTPNKFNVAYGDMGFFDISTNEGFSVQMKMVDGEFSLGLKALEAEKFKIIAETHYDNFRTGYVKIWTTGYGNMAIDNIQMKNLDENANLIEVPFKSAVLSAEDFNYKEEEHIFRTEETEDEQTEVAVVVSWKNVVIYTGIGLSAVLLVSVIIMCVLIKHKRKQRGEAKTDE